MLPVFVALGDSDSMFMCRTLCASDTDPMPPLGLIPSLLEHLTPESKAELETSKSMKVQFEEKSAWDRNQEWRSDIKPGTTESFTTKSTSTRTKSRPNT